MATKIDDSTIEVEKVIPEVITKVRFSRKFLEEQKKAIQAQKENYDAERDKELAEIDSYLKECDILGIKQTEISQI